MGVYQPHMGGTRILSATRVDQSGADDTNVVDWVKTDDFIVAVSIHSDGKDPLSAQHKLRWRALPAGSFVDMADTGAINYSADTDLVDGASIVVGGRKCSTQGYVWQDGEEVEGSINSDAIDLGEGYESEIHFALDCSGAANNTEYEFELYNDTTEASMGTCGATLKTELPRAVQGGSRILNATRVDQSGADDANVTDWVKASDFILAVNINSGGKDTAAAQYKLRWKVAGGSFADVAATGAINFNATTDLVNGAAIAVGGRKCDSQGGDTWQAGEEVEGASLCDSIDLAIDYETEIHFALDCSGAADGREYIFELYDSTEDVSRGTCGATITIYLAPFDVLELKRNEYYGADISFSSLVMIDSTHFMVAYRKVTSRITVSTFSMDASYELTNVDYFHIDDSTIDTQISLVMIDSTHFAVAFDSSGAGTIKILSIDASHIISLVDTLDHDGSVGNDNSLVLIDSTHLMLAYSSTNGYIKTFTLDGSYNITQTDSLQHFTGATQVNSLVKIDSTHFVLAFGDVSYNGYIKVFSIDGSFVITEEDTLTHETTRDDGGSLAMIDSTHVIYAYRGVDDDGYIKVFTIDGLYDIAQTSSMEHETDAAKYNSIIKIDTTHFALAYTGTVDLDGYIKVFSMDGSYVVTEESSLEHDIDNGQYNSLALIDSTHFALAYQGLDSDAVIKTFYMEPPAAAAGTRPPRVFFGPFYGPLAGPL